MLKSLRKNTKMIIWIVVIAFALGGGYSAGSYFKDMLSGSNPGLRHAGSVFGKNISFQEFDRFYRGGQIFNAGDKPIEDPEVLRQAAWQGLILSREARQRKIEVSDEEVRREILALLDRQSISPESYKTWLEHGLRSTPKDFESQVRDLLRIRKLMGLLRDSLTDTGVSPEEARQEYFREHQKLSAEALFFTDQKAAAEFRAGIKKPAHWLEAVKPKQGEIRQTGLVAVAVLPALFRISAEDAQKLHALEKEAVSEPVASGSQWAVFRILDKESVDEKKFESEKEIFTKALTEHKIQSGLLEKSQDILTRANLRDYQTTAPAEA